MYNIAMKKVMHIQMFRSFRIKYKGEEILVSKILGKQLVNLFQLFVLNVGKDVARDDILEILYPESEDPRNALKFSIFRLRKALKEVDVLSDLELIETTKNGYRLTQSIDYDCDFKKFEHLWQKIENVVDYHDQEVQIGMKLVNLYSGRLYTTTNASYQVLQICEWYRSKFATCIVLICQKLIREGHYDEMLKLDYDAIVKEPFYEGLHYYYMKGLIETKDYHKALQYYDEINEAFYKELGIGLSSKFKELYDVVVEEYNKERPVDLEEIYEDLSTNNKYEGGFYCNYEFFKYLYEVTLKSARREEKEYFLVLLELNNKNLAPENEVALMNKLKSIIESCLRSNDIFTRVNNQQYLLLVNCHTQDNVYIITERISTAFYKKFNRNLYRLNYNVRKAD